MHRIIYIFSDITSTMSLYYEMELFKKLPEELTGGQQIITTTIVTEKKSLYLLFHNCMITLI